MNQSSSMNELKHQPNLLFHSPRPRQETNVKLYHKLIDGWAVEIIEVNFLLCQIIISMARSSFYAVNTKELHCLYS